MIEACAAANLFSGRLLTSVAEQVAAFSGADVHALWHNTRALKLKARLLELGVQSLADYVAILSCQASRTHELMWLAQLFTNDESYFFRDEKQLAALFAYLMHTGASLAWCGTPHPLRLWSAACATGDEPYTLAMMAQRQNIAATVVASDVSLQALAFAKDAIFSAWHLRQLHEDIIATSFYKDKQGYRLHQRYRGNVKFNHHNLLDEDALAAVGPVHAIVCRNVLMYMTAQARRRVLHNLWQSLLPGGVVVLGPSEQMWPSANANGFCEVYSQGGVLYRRLDCRLKKVASFG